MAKKKVKYLGAVPVNVEGKVVKPGAVINDTGPCSLSALGDFECVSDEPVEAAAPAKKEKE